jgi:heme A synthase
MKWVAILIAVAIIIMIATGNMGGANKAATNYSNVMRR